MKSIIEASFLWIRAIFFVLVFPGVVTVYVPYRILRATERLAAPELTLSSVASIVLACVGAGVLLSSVWQFAAVGRGTLAPVDPPRQLVCTGLYRFTRNPMYNGVVLLLLAEAWLFTSLALLQYAAVVFVLFHLIVVIYEEPVLSVKFGESYKRYRLRVPRWGFTFSPPHRTGSDEP